MSGRRTGTRERIQRLALELFIEQGYEKTSLREIADRLGVTKAALYYHFPSKESILASVVEDVSEEVDDLIAWGEGQPRSAATRAELLRRVADLVRGPGRDIIRFGQANEATMRGHDVGEELSGRLFAVVGLMVEPDAELKDQLGSVLALAAVYLMNVPMLPAALGPLATAPVDDRSAAALELGLQLIGGGPPYVAEGTT
jgi:AcrR family transcriptional regulator